MNPSTGAFIWQHCFTDGGYVIGAVTSTSGGVVAVGEGNNLAVVSAATGALLFTYTGAGPFWGSPTFADGTLYAGDMAGNLYALKMKSHSTGAQFVQVNSTTPQTTQSTTTVSYLQAQTAGDLNVVAIGLNNSTSTVTSVTDSAGNVYQLAAPLTSRGALSQAIYYAKNIKGAAPNNVVTVQFSSPVPYPDVRVAEYSGLDTANPLDTSASAGGSGVVGPTNRQPRRLSSRASARDSSVADATCPERRSERRTDGSKPHTNVASEPSCVTSSTARWALLMTASIFPR